MFVIGITGGIASGKSTLTEYLKPSASLIIDADEIAREVVAPGTSVFSSLVERFGQSVLAGDGTINRRELGRIVFSDSSNVDFINSLTHPEIIKRIRRALDQAAIDLPEDSFVLLRVPLLVEAGLAELADMVVVVTAKEPVRINRLVAKRGSTETDAKQVILAQVPDAERLKIADVVVVNDGSLAALEEGACRVLVEASRRLKDKSG